MAIETGLIGLARALAAAGLTLDTGRTRNFVQAAEAVGLDDRQAVFWAGRACLCAEPEQFPIYDRVFAAWFNTSIPDVAGRLRRARVDRPVGAKAPADGSGLVLPAGIEAAPADQEAVRARAAEQELLRYRDVGQLSPEQRAALAELFAQLRPRAPRRPSARLGPSNRGRLDARRMVREQVRLLGEPGSARYRRPTPQPRRVVLLIDVSGSMSGYADALLRLAHVWVRAQPRTVEVFTIGTRLTRVTDALRLRDPGQALQAAGELVPDWSGGTRLGEVLAAFLDRWGQRRWTRGAVVVIFSDGWERGSPKLLGAQMARLQRFAYRVVWVTPHRDRQGYRPVQAGIVAALPYCDHLLAGHSLAAFGHLLEVVARA
jgi:hypothetical protein